MTQKKKSIEKLVDWAAFGEDTAGTMMTYYKQLFQLAHDDAGNLLTDLVDFDLSNPNIKKTLDSLATNIKGITDTMKDEVRALTDQATEEGWSTKQLADAIREKGVTSSAERAAMISRTETATAYSAGSVLAYKSAGVEKKKWLAEDDAPDDDCQFVGEIVGIDEDFSIGHQYPPALPYCRCAVTPVLD
jgi:SPP1 gp7 family putative phage head morphogenesis protein